MASLVSLEGRLVDFNTHVEGDVHVLSNWFHRDQRTANLAGATIGRGAQVTISMPAAESPAIQREKERNKRELALIDGAHELLVLIRDPEVLIFNGK